MARNGRFVDFDPEKLVKQRWNKQISRGKSERMHREWRAETL